MKRRKKNGMGGVIFGPILILLSIAVIWKNETRYDYHREATRCTPVTDVGTATSGQRISFTGPMDKTMEISGNYLESFEGYLVVNRNAEIYAWEKDEDDDGTTWSKRWMSRLERNSRNTGFSQRLSSSRLLPSDYKVGELSVVSDSIEFVDASENINIFDLTLTETATGFDLSQRGEELYLAKGRSDNIGDERVRYSGVPIPDIATYFGKFSGGRGVAYDENRRTGFISQMIGDSGILHHIVAGERERSLATMKAYLNRLKWIVRIAGAGCVVLGFVFLFGSIARFLFPIPLIGPLAERGAFVMALCVGIPVAFMAVLVSYLLSHPFLLAGIVAAIAGLIFWLRRKGEGRKKVIRQQLESDLGHVIKDEEFEDLEFRELAYLAYSDSDVDEKEESFLFQWGKKHGWTTEKCQQVIHEVVAQRSLIPEQQRTTESHLNNLIRLAMADGDVTVYEMHTIRTAARKAGYDDTKISALMNQVRQNAS